MGACTSQEKDKPETFEQINSFSLKSLPQTSRSEAVTQRARATGSIKEIFRLADANGDGVISRDELVKVFQKIGRHPGDSQSLLFPR